MNPRAPLELSKILGPSGTRFDMDLAIVLLALLLGTAAGILFIIRTRRQVRSDSATEYLILDSEVSIEIGDDHLEIEYDDEGSEGRLSIEMDLTSASPQRMAFEIDKLPLLHIETKPKNILERRGRKTLKLCASQDKDADMAIVDIKDGRLVVSPFSSRKEGFRRIPDFPRTRKRTPRVSELEVQSPLDNATGPHVLESSWRPLDTGELPNEHK